MLDFQRTIKAHGEPLPACQEANRTRTLLRITLRQTLTPHLQVQDKLDKLSGGAQSPANLSTPRSSIERRSIASGRGREHDGRPRPEEQYEILCNDALLPLDMTLAAVRQFVWRQSAELVMHYRRRAPPPVPNTHP